MNSYIQLICLISSFWYGVLVYYANKVNIFIIEKKNIVIKYLLSIIYIFNISLLFIIFLYKLNSGVLHYYFILFIIIGYISCFVKKRK